MERIELSEDEIALLLEILSQRDAVATAKQNAAEDDLANIVEKLHIAQIAFGR